MHPRITGVRVTGPFRVALDFADQSHGIVDLTPLVAGRVACSMRSKIAPFSPRSRSTMRRVRSPGPMASILIPTCSTKPPALPQLPRAFAAEIRR